MRYDGIKWHPFEVDPQPTVGNLTQLDLRVQGTRIPLRANLKKTKVKSNEAMAPQAKLNPVAASWKAEREGEKTRNSKNNEWLKKRKESILSLETNEVVNF